MSYCCKTLKERHEVNLFSSFVLSSVVARVKIVYIQSLIHGGGKGNTDTAQISLLL